MKYTYRFANGDADGIEIADDWGNRILEFDRLDYNTERKDHRSDHKYHAGLPVSLEDAESPEYAQIKHKHGLVDTDEMLTTLLIQDDHARLHEAVGKLPPDQRELVHALFFGGCKAVDYANSHGISKAAVSQRLKRALANLKKELS